MDLDNMKFTKHESRTSASAGKAFIRCAAESVDEDGVITTATGFIQVVEGKEDALLAKLTSGERIVRFGNKLTNGNYETIVEKAEVEQEVA
jgi:hypothetical protein